MKAPLIPENEVERLSALRECLLLDTPQEANFDNITQMAQQLFGTKIALISLVDRERQWFKSRQGLDATETGRDISFCGHAILDSEVFQVPNATRDSRFADNPLVTDSPDIQFYAGAPLSTREGQRIGTLCIIDDQPRELSDHEIALLRSLASCVETELELRRQSLQNQALQQLTAITSLDFSDPINALRLGLEIACNYLDVGMGLISRIVDDDYEVIVKDPAATGIEEGQHFPLGTTYCQLALASPGVLAIPDMGNSEYRGHPCYQAFGLECYIGAPVLVRGQVYGTLNFSSAEVRQPQHFTRAEIEFVEGMAEWVSATVQRWQMDQSLRAHQRLTDGITRAQSYFIEQSSSKDAFEELLNEVLKLTDSEYGFIGEVLREVTGEPYLKTYAITNIAWDDESRAFYNDNAPDGMQFRNLDTLFGAAMTSGKPVIANAPANDERRGGLPAGHPGLNSFLGLPIYHGDNMVGLLGLANRTDGYRETDIEYLSAMTATIGQLITAFQSHQRNLENEAQISRLSKVASQTINGVIITDRQGCIEWVNDGFVRMSGYSTEELMGKHPGKVLQGEDSDAAVVAYMEEMLAENQAFDVELVNYNKQGQPYWVHIICNPLLNAEGEIEGFMAIETDISERKQIEQMKNDFVSTVNHELRTPLTSIRGTIDLVLGKYGDQLPENIERILNIAKRNGNRLGRLIDDYLDMDKLINHKMNFFLEETDLLPILQRSIIENQPYARQYQVDLVLDSPSDARICVDIDRLYQVLANLLSNAAKFSSPGGEIHIASYLNDDRIRIEVRDHGCGIPNSFYDRIFNKFEQADRSDTRSRSGSGLGLAISKELIEGMGGTIGFHSVEGLGSTFFFALPVCVQQCNTEATTTTDC